jgi:hypothetical protein
MSTYWELWDTHFLAIHMLKYSHYIRVVAVWYVFIPATTRILTPTSPTNAFYLLLIRIHTDNNNRYKYEVDRLNRELQEMKRRYYQQKRKDQMLKDVEMEGVGGVLSHTAPQMLLNEQQTKARGAKTRYAGGGFAIQNPNAANKNQNTG